MARGDQLARQWKIIQSLLASSRGKSAADLASELACHSRTVYRDLEALQVAGFPLYTEREEGRSLWAILDTARRQIPIPLSLTELMALYFSRGMMSILKDTVFFDSLESFFQKVKSTLPSEYLNYLDQIEKSLVVSTKPHKEYGKLRVIIDAVSGAALERKYLKLVYYSMRRKTETQRKVAPYKIWYFDGTFYLIANCGLRHDIRIFALDRIQSIETTDESFEMPEDFNIDDFMKASFGVFRGQPVGVKIWFAADVAGYIREKIWHETQVIKPQQDGSIVFEAEVAGTDEIKYWVLRWGSKAKILAPGTLREELRAEAQAMLANYI
jgi:predicted DNA-binding transcriptional regulator YafY